MKDEHLCLISRSTQDASTYVQSSNRLETHRLWTIARNLHAHPILREPAIVELARRQDTGILELCQSMLTSSDIEEWFVAVRALVTMATPEALERLIALYARCHDWKRQYVFKSIARILTAEYIRPFRLMARDFLRLQTLDVTGWTRTAILTVKAVCNRYGVEVLDKTQESCGQKGESLSKAESTVLIERA
ncbi:HEAT repeat domain-containing protein [Candidatus Thorarchaeota archaeon]|nr:MAG: HEAT repeat domain-containing protein [Candidatus Thorarchaeota archaeon]